MRCQVATVSTAVAVVLATGGCSSSRLDTAPPERPTAEIFLISDDQSSLVPVSVPVSGGDRNDRTLAAIDALIVTASTAGSGLGTSWGPPCAPARSAGAITQSPERVTVRLVGIGGQLCDLAAEFQQQQLAWTVVDNLGIDAAVPIYVVGPDDELIFQTVANDAFRPGDDFSDEALERANKQVRPVLTRSRVSSVVRGKEPKSLVVEGNGPLNRAHQAMVEHALRTVLPGASIAFVVAPVAVSL